MDRSMRKRGWSIASETHESSSHADDSSTNGPNSHRPRANTDHSEDTLTAAEKLELFNSFPTDELEKVSHHDRPKETIALEEDIISAGDPADNDSNEDEDEYIEMFGDDDNETGNCNANDKKRRKIGDHEKDSTTVKIMGSEDDAVGDDSADTTEKRQRLEQAKKKLSKWASRLFDPDRPRGLVEAPKTIPLNDEFLQAFGRREKEFDDEVGREINIDTTNLDEEVNDNDIPNEGDEPQEKKREEKEMTKVKITNLTYTTTREKLTKMCEQFGPLLDVNLIMDENSNSNLSVGRAYVTYDSPADAETFIENMNEKSFDGRLIRVNLASDKVKKNKDGLNGKEGRKTITSRYWDKDISTKCYRCGQVGHIEPNCPNEAKPKPCPLCGNTTHDSWSCPNSKICFNCGIPGHINRDCPSRRGLPKRMVCGACFVSGHHRWACTEKPYNVPSYNARCLVCGETGHFMCSQMRWFFGLKGMSCFNCGRSGHHGVECDRPGLDICAKNCEIAMKEIDMAEIYSFEEELSKERRRRNDGERSTQRERGRERDRQRDRDGNIGNRERMRAKSQPPQRDFRAQYQASSYGKIQTNGRDYSRRYDQRPPETYRDNSIERTWRQRNDPREKSRGKTRGYR